MMTPKLKVCGITRLEDARYAAAAGADYLGFIQYEKSPRYIEAPRVRELLEWLHGPEPVGVFVNEPADVVNRVAEEAGLALVQLHGDEPAYEIARVEWPVIKALRVAPDTTVDALRQQFREFEDVADYFLLDTHSDVLYGGTGTTFDWDVAEGLADEYDIFIAGGITAENVVESVRRLRPFGVDVSSSLESAPGLKDFAKIDAFMNTLGTVRADPS